MTLAGGKGINCMKLSEHFGSHEFQCHGPECSLIEPLVDPELVENLEKWRALLNANLTPGQAEHVLKINSGARCVTWNKHEGGKTGSLHLYNPHTGLPCKAADCYSPTLSIRQIYEAALQVVGFQGVGLAPPVAPNPAKGIPGRRGYVHVDVRATLVRVQWGYDDLGKTVALALVLPGIGLGVEDGVEA